MTVASNSVSSPEIGPTARLGAMATGGQAFSEADRHAATRAFIDTVGCMIAARNSEAARVASLAVRHWGVGTAETVLGDQLAAPWAAMINAVAAHAEDYDDVLEPASAHVSAVLVPALMALSAERRVSGRDILDAYLAGFEVMTRLGEAFGLVHYSRGWHTTLTLGAPAAAAAVARLSGLDAPTTTTAISQSMSLSGGSKVHMGRIAKPMHAGFAAKAGLMAAALAEAGTTANPEVFAGPWGAIAMMAGRHAPGFGAGLGAPDKPSAMTEYGVWFKAYPSCASTHRLVDGALALRDRYRFTTSDIARVDLTLPLTASQNLMFELPDTPAEARFSAHYCVAHALIDGTLGAPAFRPETIARPDLGELMARIHRRVDPAQTAPDADLSDLSGQICVKLRNGSVFVERIDIPYGHSQKPLSDVDLDRKFLDCAEAGNLSAQRANWLLGALRKLAAEDNLTKFDWFGTQERP